MFNFAHALLEEKGGKPEQLQAEEADEKPAQILKLLRTDILIELWTLQRWKTRSRYALQLAGQQFEKLKEAKAEGPVGSATKKTQQKLNVNK